LYSLVGQAQNTQNLGFQVQATLDTVDVYRMDGIGTKQIAIKMPFGGHQVLNPAIEHSLRTKQIRRIDLVYTDYPKGADLIRLNRRRMAQLYLLLPDLFDQKDIEWRLVMQKKFKGPQDAARLFHGFVVSFVPPAAPMTTTPIVSEMTAREAETVRKIMSGEQSPKDSTVISVLNRHQWKNMLIVGDLTGSMAPYTGQLLLWLRMNMSKKNVKQFVFFNDGDAKADRDKELGRTGGIYNVRADTLDAVLKTALRTMEGGNGGDNAENDIEALIKAIEMCPTCEEVVLIADNWARVRDMQLLDKITKPVKVIACGALFAYNPDLLEIARSTKGSFHTMSEDLGRLMELNEGQVIHLGTSSFKIEKGRFVPIK
jgi:hypothetical protein